MITHIRSAEVKIRKEKKCFCCYEKFPKGTKMNTSTNVGDGRIYTLYICDECEEYMSKHDVADCDGIYYEGCVAEAKRE